MVALRLFDGYSKLPELTAARTLQLVKLLLKRGHYGTLQELAGMYVRKADQVVHFAAWGRKPGGRWVYIANDADEQEAWKIGRAWGDAHGGWVVVLPEPRRPKGSERKRAIMVLGGGEGT